ncbi:MAG: hypothetical protein KatS3mg129_1087 [Leptospiraceae bacterium]|nr:MAG: hypothetical protein KatS3mg129_1087 [Leptospiraceae bacterium]
MIKIKALINKLSIQSHFILYLFFIVNPIYSIEVFGFLRFLGDFQKYIPENQNFIIKNSNYDTGYFLSFKNRTGIRNNQNNLEIQKIQYEFSIDTGIQKKFPLLQQEKQIYCSKNLDQIILQNQIYCNKEIDYIASIHRSYLQWNKKNQIYKIGRFSLSWGQSRFFNPLDVLQPVSFYYYDLEDIPGKDLFYYSYNKKQRSIEVVLEPVSSNYNFNKLSSKYFSIYVKYNQTIRNLDYSIITGKESLNEILGFDSSLNWNDFNIRFGLLLRNSYQMLWLNQPKKKKIKGSFVSGISYSLKKIKFELEFFYNGEFINSINQYDIFLLDKFPYWNKKQIYLLNQYNYKKDISYFIQRNKLITFNPWFLSFNLSYTILDTSYLSTLFIFDLKAKTLYMGLSYNWDISDKSIFSLGYRSPYQLFTHTIQSEFLYIQKEIFFLYRYHYK